MKPLVELPAPPAAALTPSPQPPSPSSPAETTPRDTKTPAAPATALPASIKAAADGDVIQQLKLGRMYRDGTVGVKDPIKAYYYFTIAAARGSKEATAERDEFSRTMTGEQRRIGFNDAYEWLMSHPVSR
jgi:TPR repeat protein